MWVSTGSAALGQGSEELVDWTDEASGQVWSQQQRAEYGI